MTKGQRVRVVEVLATWDATHRRLGTTGAITRIDSRPRAPYVVLHDDGEVYAYGFRSLQPIDTETAHGGSTSNRNPESPRGTVPENGRQAT
jgi:hypothetical protein